MSSPETLVVILAGGYSSRMGKPKALLSYTGKPQYLRLLNLADELKMPAVISCRAEQMHDFNEGNLLPDDAEFQGNGPVSGLLSAHKLFPHSDILLIGCDYPLLTAKHLQSLLSLIILILQPFAGKRRTHLNPSLCLHFTRLRR